MATGHDPQSAPVRPGPQPGFAPAPAYAAPAPAYPAPVSAPSGGIGPGYPTSPGAPVPVPVPAPVPALAPQSAPPHVPVLSYPQAPPGGPAAAVPAGPRRRPAWPGVTALLLVLALAGVAGFQAYQINRLSHRLVDADRRLAEAQSGDAARLDGLEGRTAELESQAGKLFNPEAVSTAVLPSVFRVSAGQFTGTAFAVGKPVAGGGTNLFTNFHVVESVWQGGGRKVFIERKDQRFPATIVKVDKTNDVALLKSEAAFTGLVTAAEPVKSGQQIVVVGAPLGLEDSVTTGVVSAFRKNPEGSGTVIQFDAPINPGNSGGPVINGAKQVVGIATAKARDAEGIGLAVPIKTACDQFKIC